MRQSIMNEIADHLRQFFMIAPDSDIFGGDILRQRIGFDRHMILLGDGAVDFDRVLDGSSEVDGFGRHFVLALLDAAEREQILNELRHARHLRLHCGEEFIARFFILVFELFDDFEIADQCCQRRFEFMAGMGDEIAAHLVGQSDVGFFLEADEEEGLHAAARRQRRFDGDMKIALDRHHDMPFDRARRAIFEAFRKSVQHDRIAHNGGYGQGAQVLALKQAARGAIAEPDFAIHADKEDGVGDEISGIPAHRIAPFSAPPSGVDRGRRPGIDQCRGRDDRKARRRQPERHESLNHKQGAHARAEQEDDGMAHEAAIEMARHLFDRLPLDSRIGVRRGEAFRNACHISILA